MNIYVRCTSRDITDKTDMDIVALVDRIAEYINSNHYHLVCHRFVDTGLAKRLIDRVKTPIYSGTKLSYMEHSDVLVFLPGGCGTISDLCTSIKSKREGKFKKPIIIVNINGFFNPLLSQFECIKLHGFSSKRYDKHHDIYNIVSSSEELLSLLDLLKS